MCEESLERSGLLVRAHEMYSLKAPTTGEGAITEDAELDLVMEVDDEVRLPILDLLAWERGGRSKRPPETDHEEYELMQLRAVETDRQATHVERASERTRSAARVREADRERRTDRTQRVVPAWRQQET